LTEFSTLGLCPANLKTLAALGFATPTPIQRQAIPPALAGRDVMGIAQTGTGKTAAFGLPLTEALAKDSRRPAPRMARALILAPTRELATQLGDHLRHLAKPFRLTVGVVVGGASIGSQSRALERGTDILVATPGRLLDLVERQSLDLARTSFLVLDEADRMLDLGFIHALRRIARMVGSPRQTLMFSATMPKEIATLAGAFLKNPARVEVAPAGRAAEKVRQSVQFAGRGDKPVLLRNMLAKRPGDLSLVFARTKRGAEKLRKYLEASGLPAASIHGNKSQNQREQSLRGFRDGKIRVLVATDIAARGIDVAGISHVYNYDLPDVPETYVHRIGRTARAGATGEAVALCAPDEMHLLAAIEKLTGEKLVGERPVGKTMADDNSAGQRPAGDRHRGARHGANPPAENRRASERTGGGRAAGAPPRDHAAGAGRRDATARPRRRTRRLRRPAA
jgi:ATP-dependent RNA helicase RhlE